ncbi:hypothetical protein E2C01_081978 [Portunus trituberculatus]|uniref:Uncharacterized protein n=1 Tax=Portunus trituberculatus TaxID=210409 RepID=A0A5B7J0C0_PORTR|nr:hypothetical protein [Portunus trituberculatus]
MQRQNQPLRGLSNKCEERNKTACIAFDSSGRGRRKGSATVNWHADNTRIFSRCRSPATASLTPYS